MTQTAKHDAILAAHPVEIWLACEQAFHGEKWLSWDPETILLSLGSDISDEAVDKLLAVQAVASNAKATLTNADAFEKTVNAFCNNICVMDVSQPPEVEEMSYAVSQIGKLILAVHGPKAKIAFDGEVPGYVAATAKFRGWSILPKNLAFAQEMLDCLTCAVKDSKLYREHQAIIEAIEAFVAKTTRKDARDILKDVAIQELERDEPAQLIVRRMIGALLYDPTLPYSREMPRGQNHPD